MTDTPTESALEGIDTAGLEARDAACFRRIVAAVESGDSVETRRAAAARSDGDPWIAIAVALGTSVEEAKATFA